ncbi:RNA polymerase sigma factor [Mycetocola reblochoni]|uniref:RNA polymerase sigma factor RpoE n=2 Tax=Mycetocola reblochoni TaxID=331618 RepID=A0A1R4INA0_9MICO|nr:RNA polymerase sigma factor [Mycetocola reblochoni]RLP67893.1 RNA polymerase sigma factor [Mycetocola reblochoni]SJN21386.1 RNA polymerase sigma factor RpoE [Mycetocola reblochoni REB411]
MEARDELSDGVLAQMSIDGDERAFAVLLRRHAGYLRAYAIRLTGSRADADDVVQAAFITAWRRLDSLNEPDRFKAWMRRIVSNRSIDLIRSRRVEDTPIDDQVPSPERDDPERRAIAGEGLQRLSAALEALPSAQREVWAMRELGGLSYEEIAAELGVTAAVVRGRLARARATLVHEVEVWR